MVKEYWKPSNMLYPVPPVMVTCRDENGNDNVMTAAWAGTICSDPVMVSVSIRKERYSHDIIERTGEFVINLTTEQTAWAADYVGVRSGRDEDKFQAAHLHKSPSQNVKCPGIEESPVSLECRVEQVLRLGTHDMFIGRVLSTDVDPRYLDENGKFDLDRAGLVAYSHGEYWTLGRLLGTFGYSVRKRPQSKTAHRAKIAGGADASGRPAASGKRTADKRAAVPGAGKMADGAACPTTTGRRTANKAASRSHKPEHKQDRKDSGRRTVDKAARKKSSRKEKGYGKHI